MVADRSAAEGGWLSLGDEAVPLRDAAVADADRERGERLRLIGEAHRSAVTSLRVQIGGAAALLGVLALLGSEHSAAPAVPRGHRSSPVLIRRDRRRSPQPLQLARRRRLGVEPLLDTLRAITPSSSR